MWSNIKRIWRNWLSKIRRFLNIKDDLQPDKDLGLGAEGLLQTKSLEKHRHKVIQRAQKHRSALLDSSQRIVLISIILILVALIGFSGFIYWRLYRVQDHSTFMYNITQIVPLPVAKVGDSWVRYEEYLRELRRQIHYFETHYQFDFDQASEDDFITLTDLKNNAMQRVLTNTYIRQLATDYDLTVTEAEIDQQIDLIQSRISINPTNLEDVLADFWGLDIEDYRQAVADVLLQQKVIRQLDVTLENNARLRMEAIQSQLISGQDFGDIARELSEDVATARNGGQYNFDFSLDSQEEHPLVIEAIFETEVDQISDIIDTGRRLEIIKVNSDDGEGLRRVSHITIYYLPLSDILRDIQAEQELDIFIDGIIYSQEAIY